MPPPDSPSSTDGAGRLMPQNDVGAGITYLRGRVKKLDAELKTERERTRVLEEALPNENEQGHLFSIYEAALARAQKAERDRRLSGGRLPPDCVVKALYDDAALLLKLADQARDALASFAAAAVEDDGHGEGYEARQARPVPAGEGADAVEVVAEWFAETRKAINDVLYPPVRTMTVSAATGPIITEVDRSNARLLVARLEATGLMAAAPLAAEPPHGPNEEMP